MIRAVKISLFLWLTLGVLSVLLLAGLAGCAPVTKITLDSQYLPLRVIDQEPFLPPGIIHTRGEVCYTRSIQDFENLPAVEQKALLLHERLHSQRQLSLGLDQWLRDFANFPTVRWQEEKMGWEIQLRYEAQNGFHQDPAWVARFLSENYDGMVGYDYALPWVQNVIDAAGR